MRILNGGGASANSSCGRIWSLTEWPVSEQVFDLLANASKPLGLNHRRISRQSTTRRRNAWTATPIAVKAWKQVIIGIQAGLNNRERSVFPASAKPVHSVHDAVGAFSNIFGSLAERGTLFGMSVIFGRSADQRGCSATLRGLQITLWSSTGNPRMASSIVKRKSQASPVQSTQPVPGLLQAVRAGDRIVQFVDPGGRFPIKRSSSRPVPHGHRCTHSAGLPAGPERGLLTSAMRARRPNSGGTWQEV